MDKSQFIRRFSLHLPVEYHGESVKGVAGYKQEELRPASVLIGCVERENGIHIILTRRAAHLKHHPGQISFPGGKQESYDPSPEHTAIREAYEETGIKGDQVRIIGTLPPLVTITRFLVTPVVAMVSADYEPVIDQNEVESLFEVPADHLLDIEQLYSQLFNIRGHVHRVFAIPYREHFIWGVTAQIIQAMQQQVK